MSEIDYDVSVKLETARKAIDYLMIEEESNLELNKFFEKLVEVMDQAQGEVHIGNKKEASILITITYG